MYYHKPNYSILLNQFKVIFEINKSNGDKGASDKEIAEKMFEKYQIKPKIQESNKGEIIYSQGLLKVHTTNRTVDRDNTATHFAELQWVFDVLERFNKSKNKYFINGGTSQGLTKERNATFLYYYLTVKDIDEDLRNNIIAAFILEKMGLSRVTRNNKEMKSMELYTLLWNKNSTHQKFLLEISKLENHFDPKVWNKNTIDYMMNRWQELGIIQKDKIENKNVAIPIFPRSIFQIFIGFYILDNLSVNDFSEIEEIYDYLCERVYVPKKVFAEKFLLRLREASEKSGSFDGLPLTDKFLLHHKIKINKPEFLQAEGNFVRDIIAETRLLLVGEEEL
ncbi:MAG: hypothetical protein INQ03_06255 [Candidatus Heimdallarchaeota archaeon]|nr:hypothetical protein [Candidatus Heimdallarchaeota archaeon]